MIKKKSFLTLLLAFALVLPAVFMLTACGNKHKYSENWSTDATSHWHACTSENCDKTKDNSEHTFTTKKDNANHWEECSVCGFKKNETAHTLTVKERNIDDHVQECSLCGYETGSQEHVFDDDTTSECDICGQERTQTTLAFKPGMSYTAKTYNAQSQAFDKASLISTNVPLEDVIVEYSASKTNPVWITEPKNVGIYRIRLRVEATSSHTSCTIDTLEDDGKSLTITPAFLSLTNLQLVYDKAELNTTATTILLNSENIRGNITGLCGSDTLDTLQAKLYKQPGTEVFSDGEEWVIESLDKTSDHATKYVALQGLGNYRFDASTTGKLYVTNSLTSSGSGTTSSPYVHTGNATIAKMNTVYYSVNITRSGVGKFAVNYDVAVTDGYGHIGIIDARAKESWLSVKMASDGTLVTYGATGNATIYLCVKYVGTHDSPETITNTLTLTQNHATTTIASSSWSDSLAFVGSSRVHITLKEDLRILEECKYDTDNRRYYKNDNGTEVYYNISAKDDYYKYSKNNDGDWVKESISYDTMADAKSAALEATKLRTTWLSPFTSDEAIATFIFSNEDQMYHADLYVLGDNDVEYSNIAFKFNNNKLVYVEFDMDGSEYTIEIEYVEYLDISFPSTQP